MGWEDSESWLVFFDSCLVKDVIGTLIPGVTETQCTIQVRVVLETLVRLGSHKRWSD
jgi:hypothetical protein